MPDLHLDCKFAPMDEDAFLTIENSGEGYFKSKGSRFISFAIPVKDEEEIDFHLKAIKRQYADATHHCFGWSLGRQRERYRYYDDGEPSGTAGRPIYGQILSAGITNVLIVVVRYYGGTKLGTSGLIEAYKTAASEAIGKVAKITGYEIKSLYLEFDYSSMEVVMRKIKQYKFQIAESEYGEKCFIHLNVRKSFYDSAVEIFSDVNGIVVR